MKTIVALETTMNLPVRVNLDERNMTMNIYAFHNPVYSSGTITIDKAVDEITDYVDRNGKTRNIVFPHIVDTPLSRDVFFNCEESIRDGVIIPFFGIDETWAETVFARGTTTGKRMLIIDRNNGLVAYMYGFIAVGEDLELETWEYDYAEFAFKGGAISGFEMCPDYFVYKMHGEAVVSKLQPEKIQMVITEVTDYGSREMLNYDINVADRFNSRWYAEQMLELARNAGFDTDKEIFNVRKTECF